MIKIYIYSCLSCGVNGVFVRKIKRYARNHFMDLTIYETKHNNTLKTEHLKLLKDNNLSTDNYQPIVVYNDEVTPLRSWNI